MNVFETFRAISKLSKRIKLSNHMIKVFDHFCDGRGCEKCPCHYLDKYGCFDCHAKCMIEAIDIEANQN